MHFKIKRCLISKYHKNFIPFYLKIYYNPKKLTYIEFKIFDFIQNKQ
jgi:predicted Holliday junction resolvase-like endonuclease